MVSTRSHPDPADGAEGSAAAGASPSSDGDDNGPAAAAVADADLGADGNQDEEMPDVPNSVTNEDEEDTDDGGAHTSTSRASGDDKEQDTSKVTNGSNDAVNQEKGSEQHEGQQNAEISDDIQEFSDDDDEDDDAQPQSKRQRTEDSSGNATNESDRPSDTIAPTTNRQNREGEEKKDEDSAATDDNANPDDGNAAKARAAASGTVTKMDVEEENEEREAQGGEKGAQIDSSDGIGDGHGDDNDVQVMSPPPPPSRPVVLASALQFSTASAAVSSGDRHNSSTAGENNTDTDDDVQIESCNVTNPGIQYPHVRDQCGVYKFNSTPTPSPGNSQDNARYCPKCYCYVCDVKASECAEWAEHCHATASDATWTAIRQMKRNNKSLENGTGEGGGADHGEVIVIDDSPETASAAASRRRVRRANVANHQVQQQRARERMEVLANIMGGTVAPVIAPAGTSAATKSRSSARADSDSIRSINQLVAEQLLGAAVNGGTSAGTFDESSGARGERRTKTREQMRITEVLLENFRRVLTLTDGIGAGVGDEVSASVNSRSVAPTQSRRKMEGDIPQLGLHGSFFVEGIKIGWPYPVVMQPQRQMAIHLIKALKNRRHVVLESPTGTGKSAAILCSALAWQRYHAKTTESSSSGSTTRIIYCSRTHTQVAQMVASLKNTPYRPRMAILGSRERMCIHKDLKPRAGADKNSSSSVNVNNECRVRVRNTEKYRKAMWRSEKEGYDDDDPPSDVTGDRASDATTASQVEGEAVDGNDDGFRSKNRKMCPHYRQLTTNRTATLAHSMFTPNEKAVTCCSLGGEKTKFGAHDIEDLVSFGVSPHTLSGVAIYRGDSPSTGLQLSALAGSGCCVGEVKGNGAAKVEGTLRPGDRLSKLNGEDVRSLPLADVAAKFRNAKVDPIMLDVVRGVEDTIDDDDYSSHAACPYYLSQILAKNAELIFAPYNYVLEPSIRNAMGIDLEGSIVVLDEAHNVEDTLRESGSMKLPEFELCELLLVLNNYATMEKHHSNLIRVSLPGGAIQAPDSESVDGDGADNQMMYISDVAHSILLFLERIIEFLRSSTNRFENNPGNKGAQFAIKEWRKFHTLDDKQFEVTYDGPTGLGQSGNAVGCKSFFDKLGISQSDLDRVQEYARSLSEHARGDSGEEQEQRSMNQMDRLSELVFKFAFACQKPEHFYIASVVTANGSLAYAAGDEDESDNGSGSSFKKKPKQLPFAPPRNQVHPNRPVNPCGHHICRQNSADNAFNVVRHASYCNGSTPRWEATLVLNLLSPGLPMRELANECRTVVLASGSLAPLQSLCGELNLFPPKENAQATGNSTVDVKIDPHSRSNRETDLERYGRLQVHPKPLEANHVINLQKQLLAVSIGHFPDGSPLSVKYSTYSKPDFIPKLGGAIASIIESIPSGGVLVFLPSYSFLRKCANAWNPFASRRHFNRFGSQDESDVWDRIEESKGKIIVEESGGSQERFEQSRNEYNETVRTQGSCVLFAVYRGKMSEGVSFNDDYARGVICVGIPLPNSYDMSIRSKKNYNNEQRRLRNRTNLLPGDDWYQQQAYRAIAQALGRCIRHAADYGTIVLLDSRHCDDGSPSLDGVCAAHKNLPKWMRHHVKNLDRNRRAVGGMHQYISSNPDANFINGGWNGLAQEMKRFFREAKPHATSVLENQQAKLAKAQELDRQKAARGRKFDSRTGTWSSNSTEDNSTTSATKSSSSTTIKINPSSSLPSQPVEAEAPKKQGSTLTATAASSISVSSARTQCSNLQTPAASRMVTSSASAGAPAAGSHYLSSRERIQRALPSKKPPRNTLKAMFRRQQLTAESSEAAAGHVGASTPGPTPQSQQQLQKHQQQQLSQLTASSPATATNLGSALKATTTSQGASVVPSQNDEDAYCIICEEDTKRVVLLPCKHLCVCSACSKLEKLVDCPMCRTKIEDKMEVFM